MPGAPGRILSIWEWEICETYPERRDTLISGLSRVGWEINPPRGTMFVWGKIPRKYLHMGSVEFSKFLIEKTQGIKWGTSIAAEIPEDSTGP